MITTDRTRGRADTTLTTEKPPPGQEASLTTAVKMSETVATVVVLDMIVVGMILSRSVSPVTTETGTAAPLFAPDLWDFWFPALIALLSLEIVFAALKQRAGRWTKPLAAANLGLNSAFAIPAVGLLLTNNVLNPQFFDELGRTTPAAGDLLITAAVTVIAVIASWNTIQGFRHAR